MEKITAQEIIQELGLEILAGEGGYYRQTYISSQSIPKENLPGNYSGERALSTAIYYLLTAEVDSFSAFHRLKTDEVYHFYLGDPVEMVLLYPDGEVKQVILGQDLFHGQVVQVCVPAGVWQGSHLVSGGAYALMGTTMAPAFHPDDFELGNRADLEKNYPQTKDMIKKLTRG